jgi:photosystem II stability/assembly factor-like uncharacterized protein
LESSDWQLGQIDFASPDHGWILLGRRLYVTSDGGSTWQQVR